MPLFFANRVRAVYEPVILINAFPATATATARANAEAERINVSGADAGKNTAEQLCAIYRLA